MFDAIKKNSNRVKLHSQSLKPATARKTANFCMNLILFILCVFKFHSSRKTFPEKLALKVLQLPKASKFHKVLIINKNIIIPKFQLHIIASAFANIIPTTDIKKILYLLHYTSCPALNNFLYHALIRIKKGHTFKVRPFLFKFYKRKSLVHGEGFAPDQLRVKQPLYH